jgi:hypothetical protein
MHDCDSPSRRGLLCGCNRVSRLQLRLNLFLGATLLNTVGANAAHVRSTS